MGTLRCIALVFFICISQSMGKRHHHRAYGSRYGSIHKHHLNMGENMEMFHHTGGKFSKVHTKNEEHELGEKKSDIISMEDVVKRNDDPELIKLLTALNKQLEAFKKSSEKEPSPTMMTEALANNLDDPLGSMRHISGGLENAMKGLEGFVDGIKEKDNFKIAVNALTISSGIAKAVGGPIGFTISLVLNLASILVAMNAPEKKSESEEEKLTRVISEALAEFRQHDLLASFNAFTKKTEMLGSNLKLVDQFLLTEIDNFKTKGDVNNFITNSPVGQTLTSADAKKARLAKLKDVLASEIIPMANDIMYDGITTLGKVEYEIDDICDIDSGKDDKENEEIAKKCLKMLQLYCQMSYQRRSVYITQLSTTLQKFIENPEIEDLTKAKSIAHLRLIGDNLKVTQEQDIKVLEFLVKPIYSYKRRYVINYFHTYKYEYEHLYTYLTSLPIKATHGVFVCTKESLLGSCKELILDDVPELPGEKVVDFSKEQFKPMSMIVPKGYAAVVSFGETTITFSPFKAYGTTIVSALYYTDMGEKSTQEIKISKSNDYDKQISMCRINNKPNKNYDIILKPHQSICKQIVSGEFKIERFIDGYKDPELTKWINTYKSFKIPKNHAVIGKSVHSGKNFYWGPFYGENVIPKACGSLFWCSVIFVDYTDVQQLKSFKAEMKTLCAADKTLEICNLQDVNSKTEFIKICKENEFCDSVPIKFDTSGQQIINLDFIHVYADDDDKKSKAGGKKVVVDLSTLVNQKFSMTLLQKTSTPAPNIPFNHKFDDCIWKPKMGIIPENVLEGLTIPKGVRVELWTGDNGSGTLYGTYEGPVTIPKIDGNENQDSLINSLKLIKNTEPQP